MSEKPKFVQKFNRAVNPGPKGVSRRDFIGIGALFGASVALASCEEPPASSKVTIIVEGEGFEQFDLARNPNPNSTEDATVSVSCKKVEDPGEDQLPFELDVAVTGVYDEPLIERGVPSWSGHDISVNATNTGCSMVYDTSYVDN